jgi:hypothetical protein
VYKTWVEHRVPDVVIETTSRKTRQKDLTAKPQLYARLGVGEYFVFDPDREYLEPPLQGYRLAADAYTAILPDAGGCLLSQELGLRLGLAEGHLQFYRLDTGDRLLTRGERAALESQRAATEAERADREAAARQSEAAARRAAEAELARLRAELARRPPT